MIIGLVKIKNLGREKVNRTFEIKVKNEEQFNLVLEREFKKHLLSNDISFSDGKIFAGFHEVGEFDFIAKKIE